MHVCAKMPPLRPRTMLMSSRCLCHASHLCSSRSSTLFFGAVVTRWKIELAPSSALHGSEASVVAILPCVGEGAMVLTMGQMMQGFTSMLANLIRLLLQEKQQQQSQWAQILQALVEQRGTGRPWKSAVEGAQKGMPVVCLHRRLHKYNEWK